MTKVYAKLEGDRFQIKSAFAVSFPLANTAKGVSRQELAICAALEEIWSDGLLHGDPENGWHLKLAELPQLPAHCAYLLGIPLPDNNLSASLSSSGSFAANDLKITLDIRHPDIGRLDLARSNGPLIGTTGQENVLMPESLWAIWQTLSLPPDAAAPIHERRIFLAKCIDQADHAGASVDPYLRETNWPIINEVELSVTEDLGDLVLGANSGDFTHNALVSRRGKALPFPQVKRPDGSRVRGIVSETSKPVIESIASNDRLEGQDVPKFLSNPEAYLPDEIDLSDFSDRVRGFKTQVYNSRPYVHISENPRGWLEFSHGRSNDNLHGGVESPDISEEELEKLTQDAKNSGESFVNIGDTWLEVDTHLEEAVKQTVSALESAQSKFGHLNARIVLDVIPNIESLEFVTQLPDSVTNRTAMLLNSLPTVQPPASLKAKLDAHQALGFNWLCFLDDNSLGGLLADEMGVGKTAQVIALLCRLHERGELSPSLIVLPKSLISNWQTELEKFAPAIDNMLIYTGPDRARYAHQLPSSSLVLTSYDTARHDQGLLGSIDWQVVIADEAQFVKNPTAARTSALKAMKARIPLALTGTPVENGLIEFWCIMDYVRPGLLGSWKEFRDEYEKPIVSGNDEGREELISELLDQLDPHYLRRLKSEASFELPEKQLSPPLMVPLSDRQRQLYTQTLSDAKGGGRGAVLAAITKLLMICAHPNVTADDSMVTKNLSTEDCPKLEATLTILRGVHSKGEKVLIFTQWKKVQRILQAAISNTFDSHAPIINGDTTNERDALIGAFKQTSGFAALILNPGVAGYGLNLTEANHVIHYTRPWNPAKEAQATDRSHRRGQTAQVHVHFPTVEGTVEETLARLLEEKSALSHDVMRPSSARGVSAEELAAELDL